MQSFDARFCTYILHDPVRGTSYVGYCEDFHTRFRKHTGDIKGGAKSLRSSSGKLHAVAVVSPLDKRSAMQLEYVIKQQSNVKGRVKALIRALCADRFVPKARLNSSRAALNVSWFLPSLHLSVAGNRSAVETKYGLENVLTAYAYSIKGGVKHRFRDNTRKLQC